MKHVKLGVIATICFCFFGITGLLAEQQVSVAVFPFHLEAAAPNQKIKTAVPGMLKDKLEKDGAKIILVEKEIDTADWDYNRFREEGIRLGADWIITGDIFIAGQGISIDSQMHNVYEKGTPFTFFSQSPNMGELFSAVTALGKSITSELFQKKIISAIRVEGNKRVEADAISRVITSKPGDLMDYGVLNKDLGLIYKMGYFDNVVIEKNTLDRGVEIVFQVQEKPSVRKIVFKNNRVYEEKELSEVVSTRTGSILNVYKINNDVERLKQLYFEKNYHNCRIAYEVKPLKNNQADIVFTVEEGQKLKIESIVLEGNKYFDDDDIKDVMETREKGFWSFFTSSGDLDETELDNDIIRIESHYKNNGFINVKVSDPQVDMGETSITVKIKINEGDQYKNGTVSLKGDILTSEKEMMALLVSQESELYNRELIRKDVIRLSDLYSNDGYANVRISPLIDRDEENKIVNIIFDINKGDLVYFNRINISGNTKTRDKVIRRELAVKEQGKYSLKGIQRSNRNLGVKDYFANIDIKPVKTEEPNMRDLDVKVVEKATGNFSFGGGFSSDDGGFGQFSVQERNLFGRGQTLTFMTRVSADATLFNIGFTEPWLFDRPISAGFDIYKFENEYDYYDKDALGFTLRLANRTLWDYTSVGVIYNIEQFEIDDVVTESTTVKEGEYLTSSIEPFISYDSRNSRFIPTEGMYHRLSVEYAGEFLGGEIDYTKYRVESAYFFPIFWKLSGGVYAKGGYLDDRTNGDPDIDWERFYLGGINSIRGFDSTDINATPEGGTVEVGGEKFLQFNVELMFPLAEDLGAYGVIFYDRGDVYGHGDDIDLADQYSSAGLEFRWNSPMGPIRLAYGWVIDGKHVADTGEGQFDFSIGAFF